MRGAIFLVVAFLAFGGIHAFTIDWDFLDEYHLEDYRPSQPKPPISPSREEYPQPPVVGENDWKPNGHPMSVDISATGDSNMMEPPIVGALDHRPIAMNEVPPSNAEPVRPMGPPPPPSPAPLEPQPDSRPKPPQKKPSPPHHFDVVINRPGHSSASVDVAVKPLDIVDGVVVPTPKYATHKRH